MEVSGKVLDAKGTVNYNCGHCQFDSVTTKAGGMCKDCQELMCDGCFQLHKRVKTCRNHVMIGLDNLSTLKLSDDYGTDIDDKCSKHPNETVRFYCRKHEAVGCGDCMLFEHKSCESEYIKKLSKDFKRSDTFKIMTGKVEKLSSDNKRNDKQLRDDMERNINMLEKAKADIRKFRKEINEYLDNMEAGIVLQAKEIKLRNEKILAEMEKKCEFVRSEIEDIQEMLSADMDHTLFINIVKCRAMLPDIDQTIEEVKENVLTTYAFVPDGDLKKAISTKKALGELVDAKKSKTTGRDTTQVTKYRYRGSRSEERHEGKKPTQSAFITKDDQAVNIQMGDQPDGGSMNVQVTKYTEYAGYVGSGQIIITYIFPRGQQGPNHPFPGRWYKGITRKAYLPYNADGQQILKMLKLAFERKLVFTFGTSKTTGKVGVITWNDIHHNTNPWTYGEFGYPDPGYLERVKADLAAKGITEKDIELDDWEL